MHLPSHALHGTSHICPPSLSLAEVVPEVEEDYPCGTYRVYHSQNCQSDLYAAWAWWWLLRKACAIQQFACAVVASYSSSAGFVHCRRSTKLELYILTPMQIVAGFILQASGFLSSLLLAFIYTFAQDNRGTKAHFIIFQIPVEFLPWAMLTITFVTRGPFAAMQQGSGVVAAHAYDFLTRLYPTFQGGRNYIQTPNAVRRFFGGDQSSFTHRAYGSAFRPAPPQAAQQPQSRGWTSGFSSGSWGGRGAGRRLGGD